MLNVLFLFPILLCFRTHSNRQTIQVDEACGILLVVDVVFAKGCDLFGIQRIIAPNAGLDDVALI